MKPMSLLLRGFRGIRDGLGREELFLDLEALAGDARLIAIRGANGRGKTTVLDNLTPYPLMPSRAGGDGSGAFSYYDEVYLPESVKDLVWEHDGCHYRSRMVIRCAGRRRTEAYLHVMGAAGWSPARTADGAISDGKMETYQRCLGAILGGERAFLVSAFAAQGRRLLCAYRTGEVKAILSDLLELDDVRDKGQRAADVARLLRLGLASARTDLAAVSEELEGARRNAACLLELEGEVRALQARRAELLTRQGSERMALASLESDQARARDDAMERGALLCERERARSAYAEQLEHMEADRRREAARLESMRDEWAVRDAERSRAIAAIAAQRDRALAVLADGWRIRHASAREETMRGVVAEREGRVERYRQKLNELGRAELDARRFASEIASIEREAGQGALRVVELKRRFALTEAVPCRGMALQEDCRLLGDAHAARPLIPSAGTELERLNAALRERGEQLARLRGRTARLDAVPRLFAREERCLARARMRAERTATLAARRGELAQADAFVRDCAERTHALEVAAAEERKKLETEREALRHLIARIDERIERQTGQRRAALAALERRLTQLPPEFDVRRIDASRQALDVLQCALAACEERLGDALRQRTVGEAAAAREVELRQRRAGLEARCAMIEGELGTWTMFAKCMGSDGLIALMIDDAGPELASLTNDLLLACYGPRFTLTIRTQVDTAKGDVREGFEIVVHDAERGQSKNMARMSGGERVWINDCLTRAIALYVAQCSGQRYGTLFSDESDGPLDPERKRMFMRMKREVLRLGGYEREYFISQTPEAVDMADGVIDLNGFVLERSDARTETNH